MEASMEPNVPSVHLDRNSLQEQITLRESVSPSGLTYLN